MTDQNTNDGAGQLVDAMARAIGVDAATVIDAITRNKEAFVAAFKNLRDKEDAAAATFAAAERLAGKLDPRTGGPMTMQAATEAVSAYLRRKATP